MFDTMDGSTNKQINCISIQWLHMQGDNLYEYQNNTPTDFHTHKLAFPQTAAQDHQAVKLFLKTIFTKLTKIAIIISGIYV